MGFLVTALGWYQKKIGAYDKHLWEHSIEQRLSRGVNVAPKKLTRIKTELIDVDLVRGSTFSKAKPQQSCLAASFSGFVRALFWPFYYKWWQQQTSTLLSICFLGLYLLQILNFYLYFEGEEADVTSIPFAEVATPTVMMLVLGVVHSQIVATFNFKSSSNNKSTSKRRRLKLKIRNKCKTENSDSKSSPDTSEEKKKQIPSPLSCNKILKKETCSHMNDSIKKKISDEESGLDSLEMSQTPLASGLDAFPFREHRDSSDEFFIARPSGDCTSTAQWRRFSDLSPIIMRKRRPRRCSEGNLQPSLLIRHNGDKLENVEKYSKIDFTDSLKSEPCVDRKRFKTENSSSSLDSEVETSIPNSPSKDHSSDLDWPPLMTNSECNSDSTDSQVVSPPFFDNSLTWEFHEVLPSVFNPSMANSNKVSCTIWEGSECKKVDLSAAEISCAIIRKVDTFSHSTEYLALGIVLALILSTLPLFFRFFTSSNITMIAFIPSLSIIFGSTWRSKAVILISLVLRFSFSAAYFFLLSVAEQTYKQRFLYAKHFCHLTSSRRARKSDLPHFRLNKVRNIKTWLSVRSYLKKRGPQRSVDTIVSTAFIIEVCVLSFLCVQKLGGTSQFGDCLYCCETMFWNLSLGLFLVRFMTLGSKINKKYRNFSVLITEQINLYLHMELKPHKKEELMLANNVLKLAADLLKELESPFKISGFCANPYLYNITKVVVLSAFSAVLTELLGFKLKLHNIKIK